MLSGGIAIRYIESQISEDYASATGRSIAADAGIYYSRPFRSGRFPKTLSAGLVFSNIGSPISYSARNVKLPIPSTVRAGAGLFVNIYNNQSIELLADVSKLLVPTPPIIEIDSTTGTEYIAYGMEKPTSVIAGMIQSFYDAPGFVLKDGTRSSIVEELAEIMLSGGIEYTYDTLFSLRCGYFYENKFKGNRRFFTFGAGIHLSSVSFSFAYLFPVNYEKNPLKNTFSFMLTYQI
jgi:hypothetical protein